MLHTAREDWLLGALTFGLATLFRSNGVTLAGFLVWEMVLRPFFTTEATPFRGRLPGTLRVFYCAVLCWDFNVGVAFHFKTLCEYLLYVVFAVD